MSYSAYIGHPSQLCSVEEVRLLGGKGDGMRLLQIRNAVGTELTISADRCADISRLVFKGDNMGYFSPCGYVAPAYYDDMRSMYARRTRLIGTNLRSRTPAQKKQLLTEMTEILWPKVESGEVRPTIYKVFPMAQAEQAHEEMQSGRSAGKMVLVVREEN